MSPSRLGYWACFVSLIPWCLLGYAAYIAYCESMMPPHDWSNGKISWGPRFTAFVGLIWASVLSLPAIVLAMGLACAGLERNRDRNVRTAFSLLAKAAIWLNVVYIVVVAFAWIAVNARVKP